ncbi:glutathione S-transferase family protein [Fertoebacter nigrum]|uniref:Glutathione S-transferase family protein n=1 Tax=Fertoeibacter niger TaxID=2656921 RepID=A0A8X8KJL5_9RHOB|nr:glutathione S-transferase family protein [Fertoeibacter niger]NUB43339.1 glutathione S-transferase family protein [Fertoeibacter niger]
MLTLHSSPDSAALIVHVALEDSGLPYRIVQVDRANAGLDRPEYRELNPAGLIPVLETPDGPLFETGAILLWLADNLPEAALAPKPGDPARGHMLKWLFFIANTAHPDLLQIFYPERFVPPEGEPAHRALLVARMHRHFGLLEKAVASEPALFAPPAILAPYLGTLLRWSLSFPGDQAWLRLADYPALHALTLALEAHPAAQRACAAEDLGPHPFSAPLL